MSEFKITPNLLLQAYASGVFPMSESRDDPDLFWVNPKRRGVFELDRFHISRSLARQIRTAPKVTTNQAFEDVVTECANRPETWINQEIFDLYCDLHRLGHAHSVEVWQGSHLIGGVYGVTLGAAFFGESMFSRATNGSKIALAYLVHRLRVGGFTLFDTQFITDHLASLGACEIPRSEYRRRLEDALTREARFMAARDPITPQDVLQRSTQTSNRG